MNIKLATLNDFDIAYQFITQLWDYNTYDRDKLYEVYCQIIEDPNSFTYFLVDQDEFCGFFHGVFFNTFWMSGLTCYLSSLFISPELRGRGCGTFILDYLKQFSLDRGCKCIILDSGLSRTNAHQFYENYGFEKGCYGFEYMIKP